MASVAALLPRPIEKGSIMRALLVVLVLLLAGVVGVGFYRGWVHLSTNGTDAKPNVTLELNKDKIESDKETVEGLGHKVKEKAGGRTDTGKEEER